MSVTQQGATNHASVVSCGLVSQFSVCRVLPAFKGRLVKPLLSVF